MATIPTRCKGGLGDDGAAALDAFVDDGGTLLAFNDASEYAIDALSAAGEERARRRALSDFYAPGSILGVEFERGHRTRARVHGARAGGLVRGQHRRSRSLIPHAATAVARYHPRRRATRCSPAGCSAAQKLNGKAALVDVKRGSGHVVLYGFRPQYRGQTMATYPLIWNAILKK